MRYLPGRRDLNRAFPGSESGSMALRLAHVLMTGIVPQCTHIVDLHSGILGALVSSGTQVEADDTLAYVNDPLGEKTIELKSPMDGIVIGKTNLPLVFAGEAVFNIAAYEKLDHVSSRIEAYHEQLTPDDNQAEDDEPPVV